MGMGAVITAPDGARETLSMGGDERGCNNEAELRALLMALRALHPADVQALQIFTDNSVLVAQLGGAADVPPIARLAALFDEARALLGLFGQATLQWIPRHRNAEADVLARAALGLAGKQVLTSKKRSKRR
jgi:ribonuclease HI